MAEKEIRQRTNPTHAKSNVLGNSDDANSNSYSIQNASNVKRAEGKWESNVFKGPLNEQSKRTKLGRGDKGRDGLFGNSGEADAYQRKTTFAAAMSTKEETRPPKFNEEAAINRRV